MSWAQYRSGEWVLLNLMVRVVAKLGAAGVPLRQGLVVEPELALQ
jgi:hypothetical protein